MATRLLYLEDFDVLTCSAMVTGVTTVNDGRVDVILDQTCFYPRGGGQDWDQGTITGSSGVVAVSEVRLDEEGIVHHLGTYQQGELKTGDMVTCTVDNVRRSVNTRLHSAGHVIDMAVDALGLHDWVPAKGQHYPELSAVEYTGMFEPTKTEELRAAIEAKANTFIHAGSHNSIRFMPTEEMRAVCRHVPTNIPTNKPARVVMYGDDFGIPCGGTHVKDIQQVGAIKVPKLKEKKGVIRVSYVVEGINA